MKDNRKQRSLRFIREKNKITKGGLLFSMIKFSSTMNEGQIDALLQMEGIRQVRRIKIRYRLKLDLQIVKIEKGFIDDDFIRSIGTGSITYKLSR